MMYLKKYKNVYWFDFIFLKETLCFYELFIYTFNLKALGWAEVINLLDDEI